MFLKSFDKLKDKIRSLFSRRLVTSTPKLILWTIFGVIIIAGIFLYVFREQIFRQFYKPTQTSLEEGIKASKDIEIIAENLQIPWEIAFLPDGDLLVTERPGTLKRIGKEGQIYTIDDVEHIGEGGLLGMALHPRFSENQWVYLYFTTKNESGLINRVERYRFGKDRLTEKTIIIDSIPGATNHGGGRITFGPHSAPNGDTVDKPDYYLYITTGDAENPNLAQDINSLAGKILRLKDDGSVPSDNPFGNAVYSYGHRNSQGLAWDDKKQFWATEHGRSGVLSGFDELNLIEKGKNYGWPVIQGNETRANMETPIINSGPDETWAPAGAVYFMGRIFFTGLRGESLYEIAFSQDGKVESIKAHLRGAYGRLRTIQIGPDGYFYLSTSNTDGRGDLRSGDDKIIRLNPEIFLTR